MNNASSRTRLCSLAVAASMAVGLAACSKEGSDVAPPPPTAATTVPAPIVASAPAPVTAPVAAAPAPVVVAKNDSAAYDQGRRDQRAQDQRRARERRADYSPPPPRADRDAEVNDSPRARQAAAAACPNCGVVESIDVVQVQGKTNGVGAVAGGVGGAVLGNRIAGNNNRTLGGVVGAVGGGLIGNAIEKHQRKETAFDVHVRMSDGTLRTVRESTSPAVGEKVRVEADGLHERS